MNLPGRHHEDDDNLVVGSEVDDGMARPLVARATGYRMDLESENFVLATNGSDVQTSDQPGALSTSQRAGHADYVVASTLNGSAVDDQAPSLVGGDGPHGRSTHNGLDTVVVADPLSAHEGKTYSHEGRNNFRLHNVVADTVRVEYGEQSYRGDGADNLLPAPMGVRRLTPLECERLMGWPDGWTQLTVDGKEIPDSHRYRLCGNGVVSTVAEWIGHRMVAVDARP